MNLLNEIIGLVLVAAGLVFMFFGSFGLVRLPDFFTRTHAASKVDTVGIVVVLLGVAVYEGLTLNSGKVLVAAIFLMLTNPVAAHALARAALRQGYRPWRRNRPVEPEPED